LESFQRQRLAAAMEARGLDILIAATPPNVLYCSGVYSLGQWLMANVQAYALVPKDPAAPPLVVLPISDADLVAERRPPLGGVCAYGTFFVEPPGVAGIEPAPGALAAEDEELARLAVQRPAASPQDALLDAVRALLPAARIGVDEAGMPASVRAQLAAALPGVEIVPAADAIMRARMVKSPAEQARLQRAAHITEEGMMAVIGRLREGMTEREAQRIFEETLVAHGARPVLSVIGFGPHSAYPNATPGERRLAPGDIVRFDVGCIYEHYWADLSRCAVFGEPGPRVTEYYRALVIGEDAAIAAVRPGATAGQVFAQAVEAVREAGIPHYRRQHVGHGIGLEVYDPPVLRPGDDTVLEPGMVLNVETPYYELGFGGLQIEDVVVVTEDGCQVLTKTPRELYVVEAGGRR